jgi:hypothetical protein
LFQRIKKISSEKNWENDKKEILSKISPDLPVFIDIYAAEK